MGGSKGGIYPPFASAKVIKTAVFVYRLLCLLAWVNCTDCMMVILAKIPFWKNTKLTTTENQILNFLGELQKWESLLTKL